MVMGDFDGRELQYGVSAGRTLAIIDAVVSRDRRLASKQAAVCVRRCCTRQVIERGKTEEGPSQSQGKELNQ